MRRLTPLFCCCMALPLPSVHGAAAQDDGPSALAARCAPLVAPWVDQGFFPGIAVGVAAPEGTWLAGFGETALGSGVAPDGDTLYEVGSITKVYTGLLLADAHLTGVARLGDPLATHLPRGTAVPSVAGQPIRLVHLATHSSGLARLPSNLRADAADPYAAYGAADLYAGLAAARPTRTPGEAYAYSNFGAGALGHALVRAHGFADYEALTLARLCVVHGFDDTRVQPTPAQMARLAPPHDAALMPGASWGFDALAGAGALRASTRDLVAFGRLFIAGAEHTHAAAAALTLCDHSRAPGGPPMGLGWHFQDQFTGLGRVAFHEGQTGGYHSVLLVAPRERLVVTLLANAPVQGLGRLGVALLRSAAGLSVEPEAITPRSATAPEALTELPGKYRVGFLDSITLSVADGVLFAQRTGLPRVRLHAVGVDRYAFRVLDGTLSIERAADGAISELIWEADGGRVRAKR